MAGRVFVLASLSCRSQSMLGATHGIEDQFPGYLSVHFCNGYLEVGCFVKIIEELL